MSLVNIDGNEIGDRPAPSNKQATAAIRKLEVIDPEAIKPTKYNILLRVINVDDMTEGGIFKPEAFFEKELFSKSRAVLVNCSPEAFTHSNGDHWEEKPNIGDEVITAKYAGNVYRDDDFNLYRFAHDNDVVGIIRKGN